MLKRAANLLQETSLQDNFSRPSAAQSGAGSATRPTAARAGRNARQVAAGAICLMLALPLAIGLAPTHSAAQSAAQDAEPIKSRNLAASRGKATQLPRSEGDQALVDGWPLYRTERGQAAFNDAMATLKATDGASLSAAAFKGCANLECNLVLPAIGPTGWIPPGRIWVSPNEYVLIVHSPRLRDGQTYRRRTFKEMRVFVFHEFHNSSRNIDVNDTISSHSSSVFVPLYMSKQGADAQGRNFVIIVQVAPYDVVSVHASNMGSAGPGIEVARNLSDAVEPLQNTAGIVVAAIAKAAAPHLRVVNHRGAEGQPMLTAYERRLSAIRSNASGAIVTLPFVPAVPSRVATVTSRLGDLIVRRGVSPRIPIAERGIIPPRPAPQSPAQAPVAAAAASAPSPQLAAMSPLAEYLKANLATMRLQPAFARLLPGDVAAVGEEGPNEGVVYLLNANRQVLGHVEAYQEDGVAVRRKYVYVPFDQAAADQRPFDLDLSKPAAGPSLAAGEPTLKGPIRPAVRPSASAAARPACATTGSLDPAQNCGPRLKTLQ